MNRGGSAPLTCGQSNTNTDGCEPTSLSFPLDQHFQLDKHIVKAICAEKPFDEKLSRSWYHDRKEDVPRCRGFLEINLTSLL